MRNNRTPLLLVIIALLLTGAMYYYTQNNEKEKFDWEESSWNKKGYSEKNDQPYGSLIVHRLLERLAANRKFTDIEENVGKELPAHVPGGQAANYVFIGEAMYLDSLGTKRLLEFVDAGNTAFISSKTIPFDLMSFIYFDECEDAPWSDYSNIQDTMGRLVLRTPDLPEDTTTFYFAQKNVPTLYNWHYIEQVFFCDSLPQQPLGHVNGEYINFAVFPHGKGRFLLHTTPLAFSNFSLLRPETRPYAGGVFSHLAPGDIYWDAVSRVPEAVGRRRNGSMFGNQGLPETHPLTYILQQPALAWAWYILAGLALSWLVFRAKRRYKSIPVLPRNENSSYEFISTIAHLHFLERNYKGLSTQGMRHFLAQLRERYGLVVTIDSESGLPRTDNDFFEKLSALSEIPATTARNIFQLYANTVRYEPTEEMAMELHLAMEQFLKAAR